MDVLLDVGVLLRTAATLGPHLHSFNSCALGRMADKSGLQRPTAKKRTSCDDCPGLMIYERAAKRRLRCESGAQASGRQSKKGMSRGSGGHFMTPSTRRASHWQAAAARRSIRQDTNSPRPIRRSRARDCASQRPHPAQAGTASVAPETRGDRRSGHTGGTVRFYFSATIRLIFEFFFADAMLHTNVTPP